jgi:hypothetical protein
MCRRCGDFGYLPKPKKGADRLTMAEIVRSKQPCFCKFGKEFQQVQDEWNKPATENRKAS